jgi:two-component system response regulator AtoC
VNEKKGRFELAAGGTIFLDDVDDIPLELQVKFLRILQNKEFERVGGTETIKVDVRIIAASKADLRDEVKKERFREDLYFRLNVVPIRLPPLRERIEDILLLIDTFAEKYAPTGRMRISSKAMDYLWKYSWPGNVRELENLIKRLAITAPEGNITPSLLPPEILCEELSPEEISFDGNSFHEIISHSERKIIEQALDMAGGNKAKAARLLKLKPSTLRSKIKKYENREI